MKALIFLSIFCLGPTVFAESAKDCVERVNRQHDKTYHKDEMLRKCILGRLDTLTIEDCSDAAKGFPTKVEQEDEQKLCDQYFAKQSAKKTTLPHTPGRK